MDNKKILELLKENGENNILKEMSKDENNFKDINFINAINIHDELKEIVLILQSIANYDGFGILAISLQKDFIKSINKKAVEFLKPYNISFDDFIDIYDI